MGGDGDRGSAVAFFLPDAAGKEGVLRALRAGNVGCGGLWSPGSADAHVYTGWRALLERQAHHGEWRPAAAPDALRAGACPRTLDLLRRAVHADVHPGFDEEDVEGTVRGIRRVVRALV